MNLLPGILKRQVRKANLQKQKAKGIMDAALESKSPSTVVTINDDTGMKTIKNTQTGEEVSYSVEQVYKVNVWSYDKPEPKPKSDPVLVKGSTLDWFLEVDSPFPEHTGEPLETKLMTPDELNALVATGADVEYVESLAKPETVATLDDANIVTSLLEETGPNGEPLHAPVLDLDFPHVYVPSSTPGHGHLYIDQKMSHEDFFLFLEMLADFGIIEPGYFAASKARGYSAVRVPWVKKEKDEDY